jgi:hypothetical protein
MNNLSLSAIALFAFFTGSTLANAASSEPAPLLPESLAAKTEMAANQKTLTLFIEERDPKKATTLLNTTNEEYAKKGWSVFNILTFNTDEEFRGFFVTYQKTLIFE